MITRQITAYHKAARVELMVRHPGIIEAYEARVDSKARALEAPAPAPAPTLRTR
jgi:hypothetical protein